VNLPATITIEYNDEAIEIEEGATLGEVFKKTSTSYIDGAIIGIVRGGKEIKERTAEYSVHTNKGEFKIEVDPEKPDLVNIWLANFVGPHLNAHWATPDVVAFGPIATDIKPDRDTYEYQRFDVIFGAGGYDAKKTYVLLAKDKHSTSYGGAAGGGVFARVISGKNIIAKLDQGDSISRIEPVIRWETLVDKVITTDLDMILEDGMKIFTYFSVDLKKESPFGSEHFLGGARKGLFEVSDSSSSYIVYDVLKGETCPFEVLDSRSEGSVAIRTKGLGMGRIFISKEDRTSSTSHSIVGTVTKGLELVKLAQNGNKLEVRVNPQQVMFLGLGIEDAMKKAQEQNLSIEVDGYTGKGAIVVEQQPETTMEILESKKVSILGIPPGLLLHIKFYYDKAPKTIEYLRHTLKLKERPVGPLPVFLTYENTTLFKTIKRTEGYKEIMPENTPSGKVLSGEVGVTNQASKQYGIIGVKNEDDERYGPTGEKFHCTNIIGKVLDAEKLRSVNQGDIIYIIEVE
jgi:putative methanogenesis marker protein 3